MSVHHHDQKYYDWLMKNQPRCVARGCLNRSEELHHVSLIPSAKHAGLLPRRHSSYQVVPLCQACHYAAHNTVAEEKMLPALLDGVVWSWLVRFAQAAYKVDYKDVAGGGATPKSLAMQQRLRLLHDYLTERMENRE